LQSAVGEHGADFGACFDGDADRCIFVDEHAEMVACDLLTALLAGDYLKDNPGATVVFDLRSSRVVREQILEHGGVPKRQRVGHVFMKRAMADSNGIFGGELSGHFYFRDNWYCDSGMLAFVAVVNVLTRRGESLSTLLKPLAKYASSGERNFRNEDKEGTFAQVAEMHRDAEIDHLDGVTVQYADWWFNIRASNTEPLLRLNMEAAHAALLEEKLAELAPILGEPDKGH
jgi:phosphomannomutase